ncbi:hypothetical protein QA645_13820 [Bradyrhizobium sp. CIAT3101]|uniref:hypothetical protein n=1 Tax=Bradyrhizobium sp. CIAT3101 TaxID=439387 RepID=UPI0024B09AFC|nr:hypothetical protein [Bradyrhizobium sp. CIAT3101]WFU83774.1 hypothetical protein QA645_13820 [Bradyrhizobium sp. CIAT3101]
MTHPLLTALAQARRRDAPMFVRWCELHDVIACPATPSSVARFVIDCASLGVDRLWPAVQEISRMHASLGLADPTLGGPAAAAMSAAAAVVPPRSWPGRFKERFRTLPYDIQAYLAAHETQRERALRRAQNEAASACRKLAALENRLKDGGTHGDETTARDET